MARKKTLLEGDTNITPEQLKTLVRVMKDPFFFSTFCYVINPVLGMVKFLLYPFQKAVLYQFMLNRFNIILKFRQAGITELISMYCLWLAMYHPNKKINIISIKDTVAKKVLKKIKFMYKNLPSYLQEPIINGRTGEFGSVSTIEFANGSIIESIPTSDQAGRSESLSLLVIDEAAIVRWASTIWASAFPTLSCISGSYKILLTTNPHRKNIEGNKKGLQAFLKPIKELAPDEIGVRDLRKEGLYTLTHTGAWRQILDAVYKGKLLTWEVEDCRGKKLDCTPKHRLLTPQGWKTVSDIIRYDLKVVQIDTKYGSINNTAPLVKSPKKVIFKPLFTFGKFDYQITNFGEIYRVNSDGERTKVKLRVHRGYNTLTLFSKSQGGIKNWKVSRLVYKTFVGHIPDGYVVDHINNNPLQDWVTNLRCVTNSENIKKSYETNLAYVTSLSGYPIELHSRVLQAIDLNPGKSDQEIRDLLYKQGLSLSRKSIGNIRRKSKIYLSKLIVNREYITDIYDIHVDGDHSYILPTCNFINHNTGGSAIVNSTPYGVGNFFHGAWVDAIAGGNPLNPIRLYWQMHPDRDQKWYEEMSTALGPKRTAQEIDGDFLSSGNTVFDLVDIKAIEECLSDYPIINTRLKGQYKEFNEPDPNKEYFIGGDCATGRGTDYSAFTCMDRDGEESAVYKGRIPLNKYARLLGDIGEKYNFAKLAPETNDVGMAVTTILQDEGYPNLYFYTKLLRKKRHSRPEEEKFPGWLTTAKNRSVIVENLEKDIRENNVVIKDPFFVQEAYTFIYDGAGRPIARGKHRMSTSSMDIDLEGETYSDDSIFGKAITNHIRCHSASSTVVIPQ
jgi:hypothetical protein